jgi:hypothetical protein
MISVPSWLFIALGGGWPVQSDQHDVRLRSVDIQRRKVGVHGAPGFEIGERSKTNLAQLNSSNDPPRHLSWRSGGIGGWL